MTEAEYLNQLIEQGYSTEQAMNKLDEAVDTFDEETALEAVLTPEVKDQEKEEEVVKTRDSAGTIPTVESTENMESELVDGSSELPVEEIVVDAPVGSEERKQQYIDKGWAFDDTIPGNEEEQDIINQLPLDVDLVEKFGEETIMISMGEYERSGFDMDAKINPNSNVT